MESERYVTATEPIEVWLRQENMKVDCTVVYEDESTDEHLVVDSLSMRGAQREITGYLIAEGYEAVGRWATEAAGGDDETLGVLAAVQASYTRG